MITVNLERSIKISLIITVFFMVLMGVIELNEYQIKHAEMLNSLISDKVIMEGDTFIIRGYIVPETMNGEEIFSLSNGSRLELSRIKFYHIDSLKTSR